MINKASVILQLELDLLAMINKAGVIFQLELDLLLGCEEDHLQLELDLLLGFEDDDNTALINHDGATLLPELNLQTRRVPGAGAQRVGLAVCHHDTLLR